MFSYRQGNPVFMTFYVMPEKTAAVEGEGGGWGLTFLICFPVYPAEQTRAMNIVWKGVTGRTPLLISIVTKGRFIGSTSHTLRCSVWVGEVVIGCVRSHYGED
ncbi:hypothetical protein CDAR_598201 [Caerostris darwini]|uniref:Uncharacterized protein n=1 Tax=Caerostris darwini TaxID=1538125 RepID=A0AAV4QNG8_9ARAC|nr:hypothetical protein CDAR_598201 [Caerostris darwini]